MQDIMQDIQINLCPINLTVLAHSAICLRDMCDLFFSFVLLFDCIVVHFN